MKYFLLPADLTPSLLRNIKMLKKTLFFIPVIFGIEIFCSTSLAATPVTPGIYSIKDGSSTMFLRSHLEPNINGEVAPEGHAIFNAATVTVIEDTPKNTIMAMEKVFFRKPTPDAANFRYSIETDGWYLRVDDGRGKIFEPWTRKVDKITQVDPKTIEFEWVAKDGWHVKVINHIHASQTRNGNSLTHDLTLEVIKAPAKSYSVIYGTRFDSSPKYFSTSEISIPKSRNPDIINLLGSNLEYNITNQQFEFRSRLIEVHTKNGNKYVLTNQFFPLELERVVQAPKHMGYGIAHDLDFLMWVSGVFGPVLEDLTPVNQPLSPVGFNASNYGFQWKVKGTGHLPNQFLVRKVMSYK